MNIKHVTVELLLVDTSPLGHFYATLQSLSLEQRNGEENKL
jgi:hypothetical protein